MKKILMFLIMLPTVFTILGCESQTEFEKSLEEKGYDDFIIMVESLDTTNVLNAAYALKGDKVYYVLEYVAEDNEKNSVNVYCGHIDEADKIYEDTEETDVHESFDCEKDDIWFEFGEDFHRRYSFDTFDKAEFLEYKSNRK